MDKNIDNNKEGIAMVADALKCIYGLYDTLASEGWVKTKKDHDMKQAGDNKSYEFGKNIADIHILDGTARILRKTVKDIEERVKELYALSLNKNLSTPIEDREIRRGVEEGYLEALRKIEELNEGFAIDMGFTKT